MAKINIYYLASRRPLALEILVYFLKKIKNKNLIKLFILCDYDINTNEHNQIYDTFALDLNKSGLDTEVCANFGPHNNYMSKIQFALNQKSEYSIKLDEDIFMNHNVWDFMFENVSALDDMQNLLISPILSNGIPTCDMFLDDFLDHNEKADIHKYFLSTKFTPLWGVDYSFLNKHTLHAGGSWSPQNFYNSVSQINKTHGNNYFYKGIHPVRINYQANRRVNDYIVGKWDKFCEAPISDMRLEKSKRPYLCNSVFLIKTSTWQKINDRKDLFRDDYDEVPINLYREQNNLNWLFIRHGYCWHTIYNTVQRYDYENEVIAYVTNLTRGRIESGR